MTLPVVFGPYELRKRIARSDLAASFAARWMGGGDDVQIVSLRVLLAPWFRRSEMQDVLTHELGLATRLSHVNVMQTFDHARTDRATYSVLEYVDGTSLSRVLAVSAETGRPVPADVAAFIAAELCAALSYAHGRRDERGQSLGIVHTDVRPRNILLSTAGEVKLADFGSARARLRVEGEVALRHEDRLQSTAPELARGEDYDARADVFAVAAVAWTMLAGRAPWHDLSGAELLSAARRGQIPALRSVESSVPESLADIVTAALAVDPEARTKSAADLRTALANWLRSNAPGFGRHRLKAFLQKEVPGALSSALAEGDWKPLTRKEWQACDPASLLQPGTIEGPRPDLDALLEDTVAAPVAAGTTAPPSRPAGAPKPPIPVTRVGAPPSSLPTRNPALAGRVASAALHEEATDDGIDDEDEDSVAPAPAGPRVEGPAAGVVIAQDDLDEDGVPLPRRVAEPGVVRPREVAAAPAAAQPRPVEDPNALDPELLAKTVYDDSIDDNFGRNVARETKARRAAEARAERRSPLPWIAAVVVLVGAGAWAAVRVPAMLTTNQEEAAPTTASLFITSRPQGALIKVDGQPTTLRTPAPVRDLAPGAQVLISLELPGFDAPEAQPIRVEAGPQQTLTFDLQPSAHTIHVSSEPPGAGIVLDGVLVGTTPTSVGPLRVDSRQGVELLLRLDGYFDERVAVDWTPGQSQTALAPVLRPDPNWVPPPPADEAL